MHAPAIRALGGASCSSATTAASASSSARSRVRRVAAAPSSTASRLAGAANKRDKMTGRLAGARAPAVATRASSDEDGGAGAKTSLMGKADELLEKVGLSLGPIGMTLGESKSPSSSSSADDDADDASLMGKAGELMDKAGVSLGPIGMTLGESSPSSSAADRSGDAPADAPRKSIANMTTAEWRAKFVNPDGTVDLFLEDEYNAASRLAGARECDSLTNVENIAWSGLPTDAVSGVRHKVKVTDHVTGEVLELDVPENRYVLFEAEQEGWELPNACRMGCCTKCAVKVTKGKLAQPEALGLSRRYREEGYALLCVSTALSDVECVTQDEEEVYQMQFGELFQQLATDKNAGSILRDDFALEIADMDE